MPKVGMGPVRRAQIIQATLQTIDQVGLANTTLALVAKLAVTPAPALVAAVLIVLRTS